MKFDYRFCSDCKGYKVHASKEGESWHCLNSIRHTLTEKPIVLCHDCNLPIILEEGCYRLGRFSYHSDCWKYVRDTVIERAAPRVGVR